MMDAFLRITLLFDFYGELLTAKQREFITMYFFDDLSLNEIAQARDITPQGVRDLIKRTEKLLERYESALKLLEKYMAQKESVDHICRVIDGAKGMGDLEKRQIINTIQSLID